MISTKLPIYSYHNTELPHQGDGALFHFTSLKSFANILEDMTLQLSSFENLNDLNEGNVHNMNMNENFEVMYQAKDYIKKHCHILSFSQNYNICGYEQEGSNHPAMWAHYAENSNGVCIVLDKETFIKKNKNILNSHFYRFEDVLYDIFNTPNVESINYNEKTPQEFVKNNYKALFFIKHIDWKNEDEHRLFIMDYDGKLSINGCIKYIVLGEKLSQNTSNIKSIMDKVVNNTFKCYHKFIPHSFARMHHSIHGYLTMDMAKTIKEVIEKNLSDERYANYYKWLQEELGERV